MPLQRTVEAAASSVSLYSYSIYLQLSDWHINANRNVTSQQQTFRVTGSVIRCKRNLSDEFGWDQKQNQVLSLSLSLCLSYMSKVLIVTALLHHFSTCVDSLTRAFHRQLKSITELLSVRNVFSWDKMYVHRMYIQTSRSCMSCRRSCLQCCLLQFVFFKPKCYIVDAGRAYQSQAGSAASPCEHLHWPPVIQSTKIYICNVWPSHNWCCGYNCCCYRCCYNLFFHLSSSESVPLAVEWGSTETFLHSQVVHGFLVLASVWRKVPEIQFIDKFIEVPVQTLCCRNAHDIQMVGFWFKYVHIGRQTASDNNCLV